MPLIAPGDRPLAGLSTDLYFPPVADLLRHLEDSPPEYLEIFRARTVDLKEIRSLLPPTLPLTYHGDCLWYTQPSYSSHPAFREEERRASRHLEALGSPWMIHECAQKSIEGFDFGLYAPPLLTPESARVAREGAMTLAQAMAGRLLLVETPPFPPHPPGEMDLADFFDVLTRGTSLAIGLDLGHCLTYFAASGRPIDIPSTLAWLRGFPLERVVEIHTGGMHFLPVDGQVWPLDDHSCPLPDLLFDLLEAVLSQLHLPALQGVALEVDNKESRLAAREFGRFRDIVRDHAKPGGGLLPLANPPRPPLSPADRETVREGYRHLARALAGGTASPYAQHLYPQEIWEFGGNMEALFPETLALLRKSGVDVRDSFVHYFNCEPHESLPGEDFLEIKIRRSGNWIDALAGTIPTLLPSLRKTWDREAQSLLYAQHLYNGDP
ncbi:MAG: DUF692 family multinuclear iron-containing protein [Leptospirillia bacterium]